MEAADKSPSLSLLPFEIHLEVAGFLTQEDRNNYALVCRTFANATAEKRFARVVLQYTSASIERLVRIGENDHLRKHVKVLIWDINRWSIDPTIQSPDVWKTYFDMKASLLRERYNANTPQHGYANIFDQIGNNSDEWRLYTERVEEESRISERLHTELEDLLNKFPNLHNFQIINGTFDLIEKRLRNKSDLILPSFSNPPTLWKGEGHSIAQLRFHRNPFIDPAFVAVSALPHTLKKLTLNSIPYNTSFGGWTESFLPSLKSLKVRFIAQWRSRNFTARELPADLHDLLIDMDSQTVPTIPAGCRFKDFVGKLINLESLTVDSGGRDKYTENMTLQLRLRLLKFFQLDCTLPKLRKISLRCMDFTHTQLLPFFYRHASTLKDVRLQHILIKQYQHRPPVMDWPDVLEAMNKNLSLDRVSLTGWLTVSRIIYKHGWNMEDRSLASAAERYVIEGGECPLDKSNKEDIDNTIRYWPWMEEMTV